MRRHRSFRKRARCVHAFSMLALCAVAWGCGKDAGADPSDDPSDVSADAGADGAGDVGADATTDGSPDVVDLPGFQTVSDEAWDETAVRQVLHVFALGGFATDAQIRTWADMSPGEAAVEMITFDEFNDLLSPDNVSGADGTLAGLARTWMSSEGPMPTNRRESFDVDQWSSPSNAWRAAITRTGPNPVRHRIGLLETNYHLAVNQDAGVNNWQVFRHYDDVMGALADGLPYHQVLARAAGTAAVATQYNHRTNRFSDGRFFGNEDFARELHQLFFGILGDYDPEEHEIVTIRNTAKMLTDMEVAWIEETEDEGAHWDDTVTFGTEFHYPSSLEILGQEIAGATAEEMIDAVVEIAIDHAESLDNLPLIIVRFLADDVLDDVETAAIQEAWGEMESKNLLDFLRAYATSTTFHSPTRVHRWTSIERNMLLSNLITLTTDEAVLGLFDPNSQIRTEGVAIFRPLWNVFGGQTGLDATASGLVFREAYNHSVQQPWAWGRVEQEGDEGTVIWQRDWATIVPKEEDGTHRVLGVAEWLWQRLIADGLDNFGPLERAHVYALLGSGRDLGLFVDENEPFRVYTLDEIETRADLVELVGDLEITVLELDSDDPEKRETANGRMGLAVNFIAATPFAFAQEGRR